MYFSKAALKRVSNVEGVEAVSESEDMGDVLSGKREAGHGCGGCENPLHSADVLIVV